MKNLIILLVISALTRCESQSKKNEFIKNAFITDVGTYSWINNKSIIVKNIDDDSKIFGIADDKNRIIYQQPMNVVFSNYHKWILYADENENVYFYNGDYSETKALLWNTKSKKYDEVNFCATEIKLPIEFEKKLLDPTSNFGNCKSLKK